MRTDRANVVATTVIAILDRRLRDPTLHAEIAAVLRDEFADQRREVLADVYDSPEE